MDIIVMRPGATSKDLRNIVKKLEHKGFKATISKGTERTVIGVIGDTSKVTEEESSSFETMQGVEKIHRIIKPYKLASKDFKPEQTKIKIGKNIIGGKKLHIIVRQNEPRSAGSEPGMLKLSHTNVRPNFPKRAL